MVSQKEIDSKLLSMAYNMEYGTKKSVNSIAKDLNLHRDTLAKKFKRLILLKEVSKSDDFHIFLLLDKMNISFIEVEKQIIIVKDSKNVSEDKINKSLKELSN